MQCSAVYVMWLLFVFSRQTGEYWRKVCGFTVFYFKFMFLDSGLRKNGAKMIIGASSFLTSKKNMYASYCSRQYNVYLAEVNLHLKQVSENILV